MLPPEDDGEGGGAPILENAPPAEKKDPLGVFGRYLTVWVALCMIVGTAIGASEPSVARELGKATFEQINLIVAVLIWVMIFPMMLQIDWTSLRRVRDHPRALLVCTVLNWAVQPFLTYGFALLFFRGIFSKYLSEEDKDEFIAGAVILGGSPCTAMVFVWSQLANGDAAYTLVQVAVNDILILILYTPTVILLIGTSGIEVPYGTVFLSVFIFVVIPFSMTYLYRTHLVRSRGREWAERSIKAIVDTAGPFTIAALLLTLVLIFIFQGEKIYNNPVDILLNSVPLILVAGIIFALAYVACLALKVPYELAAPACFIATSNFFELAVAVALSAYGLDSGAVLTTVVGVLVEVPVMLVFVQIMLRTRVWYTQKVSM